MHLRWENPDNHRYYEAILACDLLGDWILTRIWGKQGTRRGRVMHYPCLNKAAGETQLSQIAKRRQQRGYVILNEPQL